MKFIFSPDIYRNSCLPTVQKYQEILLRLSKDCPFPKEIIQTIQTPISRNEWVEMQGELQLPKVWRGKSNCYIFFEIPEPLLHWYQFNQIPYLNFMTPKYRFPEMEESIMVESNVELNVNWYDKYPIPKKIELPEYSGKTVLIGQMNYDRSVVNAGISMNAFDFVFQADIFRPHPHSKLVQKEFNEFMENSARNQGMEVRSDGDIYQIMQNCKKMVGLSSSTLYEAQYCGTEVQFLAEKDYIRRGKLIKWEDINLAFWEMVGDNIKSGRVK